MHSDPDAANDPVMSLLARLDTLAATADAAAAQSGLGYWSVAPAGDVHCQGHEDDPAWLVANVPEDVGNRHVAEHIANNDPDTVLALTEALRQISGHCADADAGRAVAKIRAALDHLIRHLSS